MTNALQSLTDTIICGDCVEVMNTIPENSVHLAITSPPYNLDVNYDVHNDNLAYEQYLAWLKKVWIETKRVLVPGGRFVLNIAPTSIKNFRPIHHDFSNQLRDIGLIMRTEIIWYKQTMRRRTAWGSWKSPSNPHILPSWEYLLIFCKDKWTLEGDPEDIDITSEEFLRYSDGFWYIPPEPQRRGHPAPFPEELVYRLVKYYSYKGNLVLDMFGGAGTVAVVAYKTNRHFIHIDTSSKYCELAKQRLDAAKLLKELPVQASRVGKYMSAKELYYNSNGKSETLQKQGPMLTHQKSASQKRLLDKRSRYSGNKKSPKDKSP